MDAIADTALSSRATQAYGQAQAASANLAKPVDIEAAHKASQNFETVFLSQMFGYMFEGIKSDSLFGGGEGEEMFRSLLIDEYAKQVVKRGGVGIADAVMRTLISQQEKS